MTIIIGSSDGLWEIEEDRRRRFSSKRQRRHLLPGRNITAVAALPRFGAIAASADGAFWERSPQSGKWAPLPEMQFSRMSPQQTPTALVSAVDGTIWMGTSPAALWKFSYENPRERHWEHVSQFKDFSDAQYWWGAQRAELPSVVALAADPDDRRKVIAAVSVGGIYETADMGERWQPQHDGIAQLHRPNLPYSAANRDILSMVRDGNRPYIVFAATETSLYRCSTRAKTWRWQECAPPTVMGGVSRHSLLVATPHMKEDLFVIAPAQYRSRDYALWRFTYGQDWEKVFSARLPEMEPEQAHPVNILLPAPDTASETVLVWIAPDGVHFIQSNFTFSWEEFTPHTINSALWISSNHVV